MSRDSPIGLFTVYYGESMYHYSYYVTDKKEIPPLVAICLNNGWGFDFMYFVKEK